ncbi:uncharacterized protein K452DRAFT_271171 [Aplosporella prunicola CBS 121167]|uniref:Tat pathway signal sequence domain protein n=1 Tax=Aplosporella prunicola CBS 121167 TaxID=1176127 RepID=A0A6A6BBJ5_9PEZI|nr:uncharacterized protein K452DRAFT_271171 [Aplosporella prunicola CBS 121167]KAF2141569.1 hypothetical protein K452DRAFT_271171 [Aplosporella prunicola CBS 121167]
MPNARTAADAVSIVPLPTTSPATHGATFGVPWARGKHHFGLTAFTCASNGGTAISIPLQSWPTACWPDGSLKWTAHAVPALEKSAGDGFCIYAENKPPEPDTAARSRDEPSIVVSSSDEAISVSTGKISVVIPKAGASIIQRISSTAAGKTVAENGRLVLLSQTSLQDETAPGPRPHIHEFRGEVHDAVVEQAGPVRAVVALRGKHHELPTTENAAPLAPWLPFTLRLYLHANSHHIRIAHSIVFDGDATRAFIRGLGVRFDVPLNDEAAYDRHVRFSSAGGGVLAESPQGLTGLWKDPGEGVRRAQRAGKPAPALWAWEPEFVARLKWVPVWNDYTLSQSSPDGYTVRKRTGEGRAWVNIPGGNRASGVVYLGGASRGGLVLGQRHFWERYFTRVDVRNAGQKVGQVTAWLYSPEAEPMDLRQYHDGLGQETYNDQLDAMKMTYEDWEPGLGTSFGIARTNEFFLFAVEHTPSPEDFAHLTAYVQNPPVLIAEREAIRQTEALGTYWTPSPSTPPTPTEAQLDSNLSFLFQFYNSQIASRRWYGFWDHGDVQHTYDDARHSWRYDVGGYAWDNSELSPDLWLWLYFLRSGRADVYRVAEALTRHTAEVDVYHLGALKGLGTRHGVQHWSDSCKQVRVSNALYRRAFYYLSGGDERTGELMLETLDAEKSFVVLDPYRKVERHGRKDLTDPDDVAIALGTDWSALAASWFIAWERRVLGWEQAKHKLLSTMAGIGALRNGFVTGKAVYNVRTGRLSPPPQDPANNGVVQVSHLSAMFGLVELCAELLESFGTDTPTRFERAWLEYCRYFGAATKEQIQRFDARFGTLQLRQGHSRLTAYAAKRLDDAGLAKRAWEEFFCSDGYGPGPWRSEIIPRHLVLEPAEEAPWVSTNITALYGIAAIQLLAFLGSEEAPTAWER